MADAGVPLVTCGITLGALLCHVVVLLGNIYTAQFLTELGHSANGWSHVGISLADALNGSLNVRMLDVARGMTEGVALIARAERAMEVIQPVLDQALDVVSSSTGTSKGDSRARLAVVQPLGPHDPSRAFSASQGATHAHVGSVNVTLAVVAAVGELKDVMSKFILAIRPVLLQVQAWLVTFGDQVQAGIEAFSTTLDVTMNMLDEVKSQLKAGGSNEEAMVRSAYAMLESSSSGDVSLSDLRKAADAYSITLLEGEKADRLFGRYDSNEDRKLSRDEFMLLARDATVPGLLPFMLRSYASRLLSVAGNVDAARMRDEVALAVAQYLSVVCAKNETKVFWVADALTNGSLPLAFTADVIAQLGLNVDDPLSASTDVGAFVTEAMMKLAPEYVLRASKLISNVSFWQAEGFHPFDQPAVVERITRWITFAPGAEKVTAMLISQVRGHRPVKCGEVLSQSRVAKTSSRFRRRHALVRRRNRRSKVQQAHAHRLKRNVETEEWDEDDHAFIQSLSAVCGKIRPACESVDDFNAFIQDRSLVRTRRHVRPLPPESKHIEQSVRAARMQETLKLMQTLPSRARKCAEHATRRHLHSLLVERTRQVRSLHFSTLRPDDIAVFADDLDVVQAVNSGVFAQADTLRFAGWLAGNATQTARQLRHESFEYTSRSSGPLETLAVQVSGLVKKTQGFLKMTGHLATQRSLDNLEKLIMKFADVLERDLLQLIRRLDETSRSDGASHIGLVSKPISEGAASDDEMKSAAFIVTEVWGKVAPLFDKMRSLFPAGIKYIKRARTEVAGVAAVMRSVLAEFQNDGLSVFYAASDMYRKAWIAYFIILSVATFALPMFAWSAELYINSDAAIDAEEEEGHQAPGIVPSRLYACFAVCCGRQPSEHMSHKVWFWSISLMLQVVALLVFAATAILCLISSVRVYTAAKCKSIYIIWDNTVLLTALELVGKWLQHVGWNIVDESVLLTCQVVRSRLRQTLICVGVFGVLGLFLTMQLVFDFAVRYERRRLNRIVNLSEKEK